MYKITYQNKQGKQEFKATTKREAIKFWIELTEIKDVNKPRFYDNHGKDITNKINQFIFN